MNHTKYIFIINPAAGKQTKQAELVNQIRTSLPREQYELQFTTCAGDGTRLADECVQQSIQTNQNIVIFACGGDGTFFEVINGVKGRVPVGIFPCGSGNDFIKNIIASVDTNADDTINNIPEALMNVQAQLNGQLVPLDLIRCNDQYISNVCNIGFDADIAYNMNRFRRVPFLSGKAAYIASVLYCFFRRMRYPMSVQIDDDAPISDQFLFTVIANGQTYGGSFHGAPKASVIDGLIDVCLCRKLSRPTLLRYVSAFQKGTYLDIKGVDRWVVYKKCRRIQITMPEPTVISFDGNVFHTDHLVAEIVPEAISLMIPQGTALR